MPADEFTSSLFPILVASSAARWSTKSASMAWRTSIRPGTTLVAFSLVQMQTGKVADLEAIIGGPGADGARVMIDATQAVPFVPLEGVIDADRLPRLFRLQAPALAPRHRLLLRPGATTGRSSSHERQLARGRPAVRPVLRRAAAAAPEPAASTSHGPGCRGWAPASPPASSRRGASRTCSRRSVALPTAWRRARASLHPARRSSACRSRARNARGRRSRQPGSRPPSAVRPSASRRTSTTRRRTSAGRSR